MGNNYYNSNLLILDILVFIILVLIFCIFCQKILLKDQMHNLYKKQEQDKDNDIGSNQVTLSNTNISDDSEVLQKQEEEIFYEIKQLMTKSEKEFYKKLLPLETEYKIVPQLNLAAIINKKNSKYHNELFRNIDYAIFDKNYDNLLLLIELNDSSHARNKRKYRDYKVKKICTRVGIKLITFYTSMPNKQNYVINRVKNEIANKKEYSPTQLQ